MLKNVYVPNYVYRGIIHNHLAFPNRLKVFGADTETFEGQPISLQVFDGEDRFFKWTDAGHVLDDFLAYMEPRVLAHQVNVCYFHNLSFDIGVLFIKYHKLFQGATKLEFEHKGVKISFIISKVFFGEIRFPGKKLLKVLDTGAFFVGYSLKKITDTFDLPVKKMDAPDWKINHKLLPDGDPKKKYFVEYSEVDAVAQYYAGMTVIKQFEKFNTRICVSLPQFSVRVFRHYFMRDKDVIQLPAPVIMRACILSYHGGKNGWYVDGVTVVKDCYEVDVISMYPYAMDSMPNFIKGEYKFRGAYTPRHQGVWCISGRVKDCKYASLFDHTFKPLKGKVSNIWVTSYELAEALHSKEIKLTRCYGYVWVEDKKEKYNPFKKFVAHFYKEKSSAKTELDRTTAKLILNSLYGKTIQAIEQDKDKTQFNPDFVYDKDKDKYIDTGGKAFFMAGGMFNPFIATLITGFARAYLHRLEHRYNALHSSTDSIKTLTKPNLSDGHLGGLKVEVLGTCYMLRNKLYLHFKDDFDLESVKGMSAKRAEKTVWGNLKKYALHGFLGRAYDLVKLYNTKQNKYQAKHIFMVKEALRQKGVTPLKEEILDKELHGVNFKKIKYLNS